MAYKLDFSKLKCRGMNMTVPNYEYQIKFLEIQLEQMKEDYEFFKKNGCCPERNECIPAIQNEYIKRQEKYGNQCNALLR